jgi:hypothetical protein
MEEVTDVRASVHLRNFLTGKSASCCTKFCSATYMEQSPSWEADIHSASQEIPCLLCNPNVHYRVNNSPPLIPVLNQMNPLHTFPSDFPKIHSNIILPSTPESSLRVYRPKSCMYSYFSTQYQSGSICLVTTVADRILTMCLCTSSVMLSETWGLVQFWFCGYYVERDGRWVGKDLAGGSRGPVVCLTGIQESHKNLGQSIRKPARGPNRFLRNTSSRSCHYTYLRVLLL